MTKSPSHSDSTGTSGVRIAMWSGPRNISTALMRSWGSRADATVCDEPLYAHYLQATGREHPGREEIIAHHETDWQAVVRHLTEEPIPGDHAIFYQKHMAHHLLPDMPTDWVRDLRNAFLIRDPREMLPSLAEFLPEPTLRDTGLPQQKALFEHVRGEMDALPPVIDAKDVLLDPERMLRVLCTALGVPFCQDMLSWEPGPRVTDGVWAQHWYDAVEQSTGFQPYEPPSDPVPVRLQPLLAACRPYYEELYAHRLQPDSLTDEADI